MLVCGEGRAPYRRPPLSKDLLQGTMDAAELPMGGLGWTLDMGVRRIDDVVASIDPGARIVELASGERLAYATCLLATGSEPNRLPIPGATLDGVGVLRTLGDALALAEQLDAHPQANVAVVGSGFIGCEIAVSLRLRGHAVTLLTAEPAPQQERLGDAVAERILGWLQDAGVTVHTGEQCEGIERGEDGRLTVTTESVGVAADHVVMAVGATPRTKLAEAAGLEIAEGAIAADAAMRTSADGLLAAGDVAYAHHAVARRSLRVEHWGSALDHGAVAGRTAAGVAARWTQAPGFWSGLGERTLKHVAWGDGWDDVELTAGEGEAFVARYQLRGRLVGVLTHDADEAYDRAEDELLDAG